MKYRLIKLLSFAFFSFLIFHSLFFISVSAATPTPTSDHEVNNIKQQLITNIASKVAELKLVAKRGIVGKVMDISNTQITLEDVNGNTRFIDVDELTKFYSPSQKGSFGISDITKGTVIGALGLYNKESRRLLGRFIDVLTFPKFIHGVITSMDSQNYTITIKAKNNKFNVDIETTTKTFSFTKATDLVRSGFSKMKEGQNVIVIGFPDTKDPNRIAASRIITFPDIPQNPSINAVVIPQSPLIIPSTGSGKKLTPIIR